MTNFSSILEAAKTLAVIVSLLNGVATLLDTISVSAKKVRDFALRRLEKEPPVAAGGSLASDDNALR